MSSRPLPTLRIGLVASGLHRTAPSGALFRLLAPLDSSGIATGTTGALLNELAAGRAPSASPWVERYQSGALGGDAGIALEILKDRCRRVIFFEDPHVARQHEADIQLLERSARISTERTVCINDRASAERWAALCKARRHR